MVPRTDFSRTFTGTQAVALFCSSQRPAWKRASEGSSLRSKARTEAVLRLLDMAVQSLGKGV